VVVYLVVAACSAGGGGFGAVDGGSGSETGVDATGKTSHDGSPHDSSLKKVVDAVMHPVPEASASTDTNQSGSRLKTTRYVGTDGSSTFSGMYDSQLKVACSFTSGFLDGSTRCVPSAAAAGAYFADSMCTQPLAALPMCATAPAYALVSTPATCSASSLTQVYAVTGPWTGLIYAGNATTCTMAPATTTAGTAFYSLGAAELPASTFVAATYTIDP